MEQEKRMWAHGLLLLTSIIWGSAFVFQKFATEELSSWFITAARFTIAAVLLWVITYRKWGRLNRGYLLGGLITGATMGLGTAVQTVALTLGTTPGKSAFLTAVYCVIVPFFYWFVSKERPQKNHVFAAVICLVGIGLISLNGDMTMTSGDVVTLIGGVIFACDLTAVAWFAKGRDPILLTTMQITFSAVVGWIGTFVTNGVPAAISMGAMGNVLYLALFSTALCLFLQAYGLKHTDAAVGTILLSLESVFGVVFSVLLYHEAVTPRMAVGFAIVFVAVLLSQFRFAPKQKAVL
ncbi:MAG TPA: DMT family transporter [Candidatus Anaerotignum merdipullorum]|nr:DMT family transporter [Candidatus Anaerotignum merdipullorum]